MSSMSSVPFSIGKSVAVIALIEYLGPVLGGVLAGVSPEWSGLIARAIVTYLEFAAYAQGWITIPSSMMLSA